MILCERIGYACTADRNRDRNLLEHRRWCARGRAACARPGPHYLASRLASTDDDLNEPQTYPLGGPRPSSTPNLKRQLQYSTRDSEYCTGYCTAVGDRVDYRYVPVSILKVFLGGHLPMAGGTTFAAALASSVHGVINGCIGLSSDPNSCHKPYQVVQVDDHHHCGIGQIFHCYTCCPLTHIPPPPVPTPSPLPTLPAPTLPSPMLPLPPPPPSPCLPEPSPPPRPPTLHMPPMILWLAFIAGMLVFFCVMLLLYSGVLLPMWMRRDLLLCRMHCSLWWTGCLENHANVVRKIEAPPSTLTCALCLVGYEADDLLIRLPCEHFFHEACIGRWLETDCTCPLCRFTIGWPAGRHRQPNADRQPPQRLDEEAGIELRPGQSRNTFPRATPTGTPPPPPRRASRPNAELV